LAFLRSTFGKVQFIGAIQGDGIVSIIDSFPNLVSLTIISIGRSLFFAPAFFFLCILVVKVETVILN